MYKHDFICLSETHLVSSTPDGLVEIDGYNLVRIDHPIMSKELGFAFTIKSHSRFEL